jgi:hypothetical protein
MALLAIVKGNRESDSENEQAVLDLNIISLFFASLALCGSKPSHSNLITIALLRITASNLRLSLNSSNTVVVLGRKSIL